MKFKILKKSKSSNARLGLIETQHGVVETPCLVPVATQATIKTLDSQETERTESQVLISNTFHLHLNDRDKVIGKAGGLHKFMNWKKPLMTDSGGFQVFSLGFGKDFGLTKFLGKGMKNKKVIKTSNRPKLVKIMQDGVYFKSPINGSELFMGPKESIAIQERLGADIMFAFDECTPPLADYEYVKKSVARTHKWAEICLKAKKTKQALFGIIQGSEFKDLRQESATFINSLDFDGFGIGGDLWRDRGGTNKILSWFIPMLNEKKPRHMLGVGYLKNIEDLIKSGIDTFDCTVPTHYARRGIAFIHPHTKRSSGVGARAVNLRQSKYLKMRESLDKKCTCDVCINYTKDYICHLLRSKELTALKLLTFHNLYYFNNFVSNIRRKIKSGQV